MTKKIQDTTREGWLQRLVSELRPMFVEIGAPLPEKVHVSVGFPSRAALSKRKRRIGECWSETVSSDGAPHVFLHPELGQEAVCPVMVHELVHAAVGTEAGHRGPFRRAAKALGLVGSMRETTASEELKAKLSAITKKIGPYPHAVLTPRFKAKKPGRMLLLLCSCRDGRPLRASRMQAEKGGFRCELCGEPWLLADSKVGPVSEAELARKRVQRAADAMRVLSVQELTRALDLVAGRASAASY